MKNLFSIKYEEDHKIIDILGLKIKLKSNIATIHSKLSNIEKKISMPDNIWHTIVQEFKNKNYLFKHK